MDTQDVVINCDLPYPVIFMPKNSTRLETNCEFRDDVYINMNISSLDVDGEATMIYSGYCNVKLVGSKNSNQVENPESSTSLEIDQMPVIQSDCNQFPPSSQSQVWIDPSKGPYVYNHCDTSTLEQYLESNTYLFNYKEPQSTSPPTVNDFECQQNREEAVTTALDLNLSNDKEEEFVSGLFILPKEMLNETHTTAREERNFSKQDNNAIKQLMSSHIQSTSKQRKTILFLGNDAGSGHTLQNISYDDPLVKCAGIEVDQKVVSRGSASIPKKKKYQCDKCKHIFDNMPSFRQHMVQTSISSSASRRKARLRRL